MSRIGKQPITVPAGVTITVANGNEVTVKGPKGELSRVFQKGIEVTVDGAIATVTRANDSLKNFHGLSRTLLKNMIEGVTAGYVKVRVSRLPSRATRQSSPSVSLRLRNISFLKVAW